MPLLKDIIITVILIPISAYILEHVVARFKLKNFNLVDSLKIAAPVEIILLILNYGLVVYKEVIALVIAIVVGLGLIKYLHDLPWEESIKIFTLWFVIRVLVSIIIGIALGVILTLY